MTLLMLILAITGAHRAGLVTSLRRHWFVVVVLVVTVDRLTSDTAVMPAGYGWVVLLTSLACGGVVGGVEALRRDAAGSRVWADRPRAR